MKIADRFEVIEVLGLGTLYVVFRCLDCHTDTEVAVKTLSPHAACEPSILEAMKLDFSLTRDIRHPNLVRAFEMFEYENTLGYSMEIAHRKDLRMLMGEPMPDVADVFPIIGQLMEGTKALHAAGIMHGNVKPENVLLFNDGRVKLGNLLRARSCSGKPLLERTIAVSGDLDLLPPEYFEAAALDWRADIYAIGVIAYELVTGCSPYEGASVHDAMSKRLLGNFPAPSTLRKRCPVALDEWILHAIERDPERRFQSADDALVSLNSAHKKAA